MAAVLQLGSSGAAAARTVRNRRSLAPPGVGGGGASQAEAPVPGAEPAQGGASLQTSLRTSMHAWHVQVETLIDFNSAEGESMRQEQRKKGQILNGTYREDKDVELRHLLFSGDKAKESGALGKSAPPAPWLAAAAPAPWLAGAAPPEAAAASAADNEDEYARLMAEINGDDAPARPPRAPSYE